MVGNLHRAVSLSSYSTARSQQRRTRVPVSRSLLSTGYFLFVLLRFGFAQRVLVGEAVISPPVQALNHLTESTRCTDTPWRRPLSPPSRVAFSRVCAFLPMGTQPSARHALHPCGVPAHPDLTEAGESGSARCSGYWQGWAGPLAKGLCLQGPGHADASPAEPEPVPGAASRAPCPAKAGTAGPIRAPSQPAREPNAHMHILKQVPQNISCDENRRRA